MYKTILFDWGNTLMIDYPDQKGPMYKWEKVKSVKNSKKTLSYLYKKYNCCLATNAKDSTKDDISRALKRVKINKFIKDIYCFKEIGFEKPSNEYFSKIIRDNNCKEYLMIGDNPEIDITGAQKYGIDGILFDPENRYNNFKGKKITDLADLIRIL